MQIYDKYSWSVKRSREFLFPQHSTHNPCGLIIKAHCVLTFKKWMWQKFISLLSRVSIYRENSLSWVSIVWFMIQHSHYNRVCFFPIYSVNEEIEMYNLRNYRFSIKCTQSRLNYFIVICGGIRPVVSNFKICVSNWKYNAVVFIRMKIHGFYSSRL